MSTPTKSDTPAELLKSPLAIALAVCLVLYFVAYLVIGIAKEHRSALEICAENGGTYEVYAKVCTMPGAEVRD